MKTKTIVFFNNKGGVGKTSLVYHLSWMLSDCGIPVVAADFDPQANLTSMFLEEDRLETLWDQDENRQTVYGAIEPILRGTGDIAEPHIEKINENLRVIPGDLGLSRFEDRLSDAWPRCHNRDEASFRTMTAFYRIIEKGASWGARLAIDSLGREYFGESPRCPGLMTSSAERGRRHMPLLVPAKRKLSDTAKECTMLSVIPELNGVQPMPLFVER